jgi:hypothetical protein
MTDKLIDFGIFLALLGLSVSLFAVAIAIASHAFGYI